ncbi:MAG: tetratricopeptide repeat protein, partial [Candidatus Omnitrophota bacterium]|nr:tetratricopeptide repeat protein [Candidatus Omnitrophota bacterium]
ILNQHDIGIKFSVLDKGIVSTNTAIILSQLEANLDKYQPDMVVTMMGVNDSGAHMPYDAPSDSKLMLALRSLKVYKLTRLLWLHMTTILKEKGFYLQDIHKQKYSSMEAYKELQEEQSFKKAIEINPDNEAAYDGLGKLYRNRGKFTEAEESFKKAIEFNPDHASLCGDLAAIYYEMSNNKLYEIYAKKADSFRDKYYNINTANNYYKLKHILDKRNIKLVCAQYPICNIKPLKRVFEEEAGGIIFVDNEKIFKDAVRKTSYKEYFIDMFGGDFGHCTDKGNDLLARNIADAILKEVFGN